MGKSPNNEMEDSLNNLYQIFKEEMEAVSGECFRVASKQGACEIILKVLSTKRATNIVLSSSAHLLLESLVQELRENKLTVYTDQHQKNAPEADAGITGAYLAIAETGTLVQTAVDVDERLCSSLPQLHLVVMPTDAIVGTMAEMMIKLNQLSEMPGFLGFITGPSRTSDIERVLTIGVHGPSNLVVVFIDEPKEEV